MNKKDKYFGDSRYEKVWEQMKLLQIEDVSSTRQDKNGTIVWKLPIKNEWKDGKLIEVASFSTGYVRNNNMQSIKHLKNDYLQLGNLIYKPYTVCSLPANFGCIEFNEKEGVSEWFNYKGYTYIFDKMAKS